MGRLVNQTELAEILGVSDVTLWQWQKEGLPIEERNLRGQSNVYDTARVIAWKEDRAVKKVRAESPRDELYRSQKRLTDIQIAEKELSLVPVAELQPELEGMIAVARQRLLQLRGEIVELVGVGERAKEKSELESLVERAVDEALEELSHYEPGTEARHDSSQAVGAAVEEDGASVGPGEAPAVAEELGLPR